jgi:hypothetical protein
MTEGHFLVLVMVGRKVQYAQSQSSSPGMICFPKHNEKFHRVLLQHRMHMFIYHRKEIVFQEVSFLFHPFKVQKAPLMQLVNIIRNSCTAKSYR